jgi:crossover junction endodeoxyribonuclease RuvC
VSPQRQSPVPNLHPLVLGIDPGLRVCGWGLVGGEARAEFGGCGVIRPKPSETIGRRLLFLYEAISGLIETYRPDEVAVEEPFVGGLNPASALAIGQARAAAVLAAAAHGLEIDYYAPAAVKAAVSGYGQSDKRQVQTMVKLLLGLGEAPEPADAADALAVAICHLANRRTRALAGPTSARSQADGQTRRRTVAAITSAGKRTYGQAGTIESNAQAPGSSLQR